MATTIKLCLKCGSAWSYDSHIDRLTDSDYPGYSEKHWDYCYFCNYPLVESTRENWDKLQSNIDPEAVKKIDEFYEKIRNRNEAKLNDYYDSIGKYKCPNCGGRDTKKISTSSRIFGVAALGLASSSIGKTYKCKKCGYKW